MSHRIDLASIDRVGFKLLSQGETVLVQPLRTKHAWREDELALRSLVTDREGRVRSAGWPKFFNHGENAAHDALFYQSIEAGAVEFAEKLDGTLIIADSHPEGPALRTRGQISLGEFDEPVRALITARYPGLLGLLADTKGPCAGLSLLFEYVAPDHTIVVRYETPELYFLGAMDKTSLLPRWDEGLRAIVTQRSGVPAAPVHAMPQRLDELLARIATMKDKEGLVARCTTPGGQPLLIKLKAAEYLRIYGRMATLGERGSLRLAFLLDLRTEPEVAPAFARLGLDHEAATYALGSLRPYFVARERAEAALEALGKAVAATASRPRVDRIEAIRTLIAADPALAEPWWFAVAIKLLDGREKDAALLVAGGLIHEPVPTLRSWLRNREAALSAMMSAKAPPEDG